MRSVDDSKIPACPCCGGESLSLFSVLPDRTGERIAIYSCAQCGALSPNYPDPMDSLVAQIDLHEKQWGSDDGTTLYQTAEDLRSLVNFYQRKGFVPPEDLSPFIVEIGAGRGCLLEALIKEGYHPIGCEPSPKLVELANRYFKYPSGTLQCSAAKEFLASVHNLNKSVDVVFLWHVLEHIDDPISLLNNIFNVMSDDGVVLVQVPMLSPEWIYQGHLFLFTRKTCFYVARASGLEICFLDVSAPEQFLSFALCKPSSNLLPEARVVEVSELSILENVLGDLFDSVSKLSATNLAQKILIEERWAAMQSMEATIRERDEAIAGQARMLEERWATMQSMEVKLHDQSQTISEQGLRFHRIETSPVIKMLQMLRLLRI